jgi:heptosyltransferase-2
VVRDVVALSGLRAEFVHFDRHRKGRGRLGEKVILSPPAGSEAMGQEVHGSLGSWGEALRVLRGRSWPLAITFAESFSSALLLRLAGARRLVGYAGDSRRLLLGKSLNRPRLGLRPHLSLEYMALAVEAGASPARGGAELRITDDLGARARELLMQAGVDTSRPVVAMCPGAAYGPTKRWPAGKFAEVGAQLSKRGASVAVFGAPSEVDVAGEVARGIPGAVSLAGATTPAGLAGCLSRCALAIANDSGAAHLAAAVSTPVVAIFGSTDPSWTRPLGNGVAVVRTPGLTCAPCFGTDCDRGYECLTGIPAADVLSAALELSEGAFR